MEPEGSLPHHNSPPRGHLTTGNGARVTDGVYRRKDPTTSLGALNHLSPCKDSSHAQPIALSLYRLSYPGPSRGGTVEALRYKPEGRGFDSRWLSLEFFIDIILPSALWPWG